MANEFDSAFDSAFDIAATTGGGGNPSKPRYNMPAVRRDLVEFMHKNYLTRNVKRKPSLRTFLEDSDEK